VSAFLASHRFGFLADQMIRRGAHKNVQALEADPRMDQELER
jgi:hypothetical protein